MNKNDKDFKRLYIKEYLNSKGIKLNPFDKFDFYNYLLRINNVHKMDKYLLICCGHINAKKIKKYLNFLIKDYYKQKKIFKNVYSYEELFKMNKDWYPFFKQNAYLDGTLKKGEEREGVDKKRVDDINKIQKIKKCNLTQSMCIHSLLSSCIKNKLENYNFKKRKK